MAAINLGKEGVPVGNKVDTASRFKSWLLPVALLLMPTLAARALGDERPLSARELAAIETAIPGATVVSEGDISRKDCGSLRAQPGVAIGSFSGTNRSDFAVLLKVRETSKQTRWEGKVLKESEFAFVIFVSDESQNFKPIYIHRFKDLTPLLVYLDVKPAGKLPGRGNLPSLILKNPGVLFVNCGKSEAVYYLSNGSVKTFWLSD
jgi:hypothetical protein